MNTSERLTFKDCPYSRTGRHTFRVFNEDFLFCRRCGGAKRIVEI